MKLPLVRFTVRRMMFMATIFVATFGGFTHQVNSQSIGIDPSQPAGDNVQAGNAASKTKACETLANPCMEEKRPSATIVGPLTDRSRTIGERVITAVDTVKPALFTLGVTLLVETDDQKKARAAGPHEARQAQIKAYYPRWVGVRAPELGQAGRDHDGKPVTLSSFRGKRVLLFSFDAGDFHRAPDEKALLANLRALDKAIRTVGHEKLAVVGFTQGMQFIWPRAPKPDGELGKLSDFPMVSGIQTAIRKFNEPYNLMLEPGAILIDSKGILRALYDHPLTEQELLDAVALTDWDKPVRPNPVEDPWSGKGPPKPTHTAVAAWSRTLPGVVGMTGGIQTPTNSSRSQGFRESLESSERWARNRDIHNFVVNPGKPGKLRVGKSESPREGGCMKPPEALWVPPTA